jgi:predicted Mrr-cat superfamily restriction endonuclease
MDNTYAFATPDSTNIFIVRNGDRPIDDWIRGGFIAVGWSEALGLDKESDWYRFKDIIRKAYEPHWGGNLTEQSLALQASSAFQFVRNLRTGDLVLVPVPGAFLACKVLSDAYYDESAKATDSSWKHKVQWLTSKPCPRNRGENALQRRLKVRQTCVNVNDLRMVIIAALNRQSPLKFSDVVMADAFKPVANALRRAINDRQLEELVMKLAQAAGAKADRPPKNSRLPGDIDVIATYDLKIGTEESTIKVAYQIKQHEATTDITGIQQLVDRMETDLEIVRGYFVTTADEVDKVAQKLADEKNIIVITKKGLVEWILTSGLGVLQDC